MKDGRASWKNYVDFEDEKVEMLLWQKLVKYYMLCSLNKAWDFIHCCWDGIKDIKN